MPLLRLKPPSTHPAAEIYDRLADLIRNIRIGSFDLERVFSAQDQEKWETLAEAQNSSQWTLDEIAEGMKELPILYADLPNMPKVNFKAVKDAKLPDYNVFSLIAARGESIHLFSQDESMILFETIWVLFNTHLGIFIHSDKEYPPIEIFYTIFSRYLIDDAFRLLEQVANDTLLSTYLIDALNEIGEDDETTQELQQDMAVKRLLTKECMEIIKKEAALCPPAPEQQTDGNQKLQFVIYSPQKSVVRIIS